jgi:hypothetical protein
MKIFKIIIITILVLTNLTLLGILGFEWIGFSWSSRILYKDCQPKSIIYKSYDPYCLSIIELDLTLSKNNIIMISHNGDNIYGHILSYPESHLVNESNIQKTITDWDSNGINLTCYSGHKIFIPKKLFIGGR